MPVDLFETLKTTHPFFYIVGTMLTMAITYLLYELRKRDKKIEAQDVKIQHLSDLRVETYKETISVTKDSVNAVNSVVDNISEISSKMDSCKEWRDDLRHRMESINSSLERWERAIREDRRT